MVGRRILSLALAHLVSMETTVRDLRRSIRLKVVTVSLRDLFPIVALPNVTWILPDMALLVSISIFVKYVQIRLNLAPSRFFECIDYEIAGIL